MLVLMAVRVVRLAILDVAMAPQHQFLQYKESEYSRQHGCRQRVKILRALESAGENFQERGAQQRPDRETHQ